MNEYSIGFRMAHDTGRDSIRLSRERTWEREYWLTDARRHFDRARWYIAQIRRLRYGKRLSA